MHWCNIWTFQYVKYKGFFYLNIFYYYYFYFEDDTFCFQSVHAFSFWLKFLELFQAFWSCWKTRKASCGYTQSTNISLLIYLFLFPLFIFSSLINKSPSYNVRPGMQQKKSKDNVFNIIPVIKHKSYCSHINEYAWYHVSCYIPKFCYIGLWDSELFFFLFFPFFSFLSF